MLWALLFQQFLCLVETLNCYSYSSFL